MTDDNEDEREKSREALKQALETPLPVTVFLEVFLALERLAPPVREQPEVVLTDWCVRRIEFQGEPTDFLLGTIVGLEIARKSSPVRSFNPSTRVAVTRSGRIYRLEGEPRPGQGYVEPWEYGHGKEPFEDVTQAYVDQMRSAIN